MDINNLLKQFPDVEVEDYGTFTLHELPQAAHMEMQRLDPEAGDYKSQVNLIAAKWALRLDESIEELAEKCPPAFCTDVAMKVMQLLNVVDEDGNPIEDDPAKNSESTQSAVSNLG